MGRDKAAIRLAGRDETLLERAVRHLTEADATRIVVAIGTPGRLGPLPWEEVGDGAHAGQGPLAGLAAALTHVATDHDVALVLAVDLPDASPTLLRELAHRLRTTPGLPGLMPLDAADGRPQPLHAAYRPAAIAPHLRHTLERTDERRLLRVLATAGAVHITIDHHPGGWHRNLNTPEDQRTLERD